jgi:hypothetical protein
VIRCGKLIERPAFDHGDPPTRWRRFAPRGMDRSTD